MRAGRALLVSRPTVVSNESHNQAQDERGAAGEVRKKFTDTPQISGGETWQAPSGHSGMRRVWTVALALVSSFLLASQAVALGTASGSLGAFDFAAASCSPRSSSVAAFMALRTWGNHSFSSSST